MNADIRENTSQINKFAVITKVATYLLPVFMLLVFIEPTNSLFCGPILALLFTYLFLFLAVLGLCCGTRGLRCVMQNLSLQHSGSLVAVCGL